MKQFYLALASFCLGFCLAAECRGQEKSADSSLYRQAFVQTVSYYTAGIGKGSALYNGSEYVFSGQGISGHPFFMSDQLMQAEIQYDGIRYYGIPLAYDLVQDKIFITDSSMNFNIQLYTDRVSYFILAGHRFVPAFPDKEAVHTGFYELLYDGPDKVLARHQKQAENGFKTEDPMHYAAYDEYYIWKNGEYFRVDSKKSLFAACRDKKDLVRKFYRKNNLDIGKDPVNAIVKTTAYYGQLKN